MEFGARLLSADSKESYLEGLALLGPGSDTFRQSCTCCLYSSMFHFRLYRSIPIPNYYTLQALLPDI